MDLGFGGRKALVTGASDGIGAAVAERLAAEGCDTYLVARSAEKLAAVQSRIAAATGRPAVAISLDLGAAGSIEALAERCADADILVNNAGAIPPGHLHDVDEPRWRASWEVKVFGYINLTRALYAHMRRRRSGVIVNVIGSGGERPTADYICGATANAALMAFTRALGGQSMDDGVRVVGINPGPVATARLEMILRSTARERLGDESRWRESFASLPEQRACTTEEIAAAVAFLASDASSYTSGTVLTVDGGLCHRVAGGRA